MPSRPDSPILLGIDIGSSSTKGVAVDLQGGLRARSRRPHGIDHPCSGWAEMDAERIWWRQTCEVLRDLVLQLGSDASQVVGIGVCSIGASFVPVDRLGRAVRPAILYGIDSRARDLIAPIERRYGRDELLTRSGRLPSTQSVGLKLLWLLENEPQVWTQSDRLVSPVGFVTERFCGQSALDRHTALAWDPLFDAVALDWDLERVRDLLGPCPPQLPRLAWPGDRLGIMHADIARELGLPGGVAVACGTADVLAESLGSGVRDEGDMMVMYGSTLFTLQRVDHFRAAAPLWPSVAWAADQPTLMTGTSNAGSLLSWFSQALAPGEDPAALYAAAEALGPGAEGLLCVPYLQGERAPVADPLARGLFLGMSPRHTRAHMLRALLEGIAFGFSRILRQYAQAGASPSRLFATGGGLRVPLWPQLMADVTGLPQFRARLPEGAALGAAMLAAVASGLSPTPLDVPAAWAQPAGRVEPRDEGRERYARLTALQAEAYDRNAALMHQLVDLER